MSVEIYYTLPLRIEKPSLQRQVLYRKNSDVQAVCGPPCTKTINGGLVSPFITGFIKTASYSSLKSVGWIQNKMSMNNLDSVTEEEGRELLHHAVFCISESLHHTSRCITQVTLSRSVLHQREAASRKSLHHASRCIMQVAASHKSLYHLSQCITQCSASARSCITQFGASHKSLHYTQLHHAVFYIM